MAMQSSRTSIMKHNPSNNSRGGINQDLANVDLQGQTSSKNKSQMKNVNLIINTKFEIMKDQINTSEPIQYNEPASGKSHPKKDAITGISYKGHNISPESGLKQHSSKNTTRIQILKSKKAPQEREKDSWS